MLKPLLSIHEPALQFKSMVVIENGHHRPMELADHHQAIAQLPLNDSVPEDVRVAWERARNAFLYAWFVYDLTSLADQQGFAALEMALRHRLGPTTAQGKRWKGLQQLLEAAEAQGILRTSAKSEFSAARVIAHLRNDHAHGTASVLMPGMVLDMLALRQQMINQLYS